MDPLDEKKISEILEAKHAFLKAENFGEKKALFAKAVSLYLPLLFDNDSASHAAFEIGNFCENMGQAALLQPGCGEEAAIPFFQKAAAHYEKAASLQEIDREFKPVARAHLALAGLYISERIALEVGEERSKLVLFFVRKADEAGLTEAAVTLADWQLQFKGANPSYWPMLHWLKNKLKEKERFSLEQQTKIAQGIAILAESLQIAEIRMRLKAPVSRQLQGRSVGESRSLPPPSPR